MSSMATLRTWGSVRIEASVDGSRRGGKAGHDPLKCSRRMWGTRVDRGEERRRSSLVNVVADDVVAAAFIAAVVVVVVVRNESESCSCTLTVIQDKRWCRAMGSQARQTRLQASSAGLSAWRLSSTRSASSVGILYSIGCSGGGLSMSVDGAGSSGLLLVSSSFYLGTSNVTASRHPCVTQAKSTIDYTHQW